MCTCMCINIHKEVQNYQGKNARKRKIKHRKTEANEKFTSSVVRERKTKYSEWESSYSFRNWLNEIVPNFSNVFNLFAYKINWKFLADHLKIILPQLSLEIN